jgi:hypothetical protein
VLWTVTVGMAWIISNTLDVSNVRFLWSIKVEMSRKWLDA